MMNSIEHLGKSILFLVGSLLFWFISNYLVDSLVIVGQPGYKDPGAYLKLILIYYILLLSSVGCLVLGIAHLVKYWQENRKLKKHFQDDILDADNEFLE